MSNRHDLLIRLDSEFSDKGFRSAEQSAKTLERELNKQEAAERSLANMQIAAAREDQQRRAAQAQSMTSLGKGFTAVGLLAAAGLGVATKASMDWESAWAGVTKTVNGSDAEMAQLENQLRSLARTLPATHEEIAGVAEAAGQLGVGRKDIAAFTKTMIDLGVSTNLTSDEAATSIAQISNVMGTMAREGTDGISRFGATLVALGNAGASTEKDILDMAARLSGAGKLIGASESDVLALANAMSSVGIEAELGGGAMSRTMLKINSAVKAGGDSLDGFAKVAGVTADVFAQKWQSDPVAAVDMFVKGLARVNSSGGDAAGTLASLGLAGTQNAQVLLRMSGAGDLLTQSLTLGNQAWEQNSALVNEANKRYETTASRVKIAQNQLNDAAIDIGANVLPVLAGAADRVGVLAEAFHGLPDPIKEAVTLLGGTVTTIGLLGGAALMLIPKLAAMNATLAATGRAGAATSKGLSAVGSALTGPWGIALAGAALAVGVFAEGQYKAKQRAEELAATLDAQTAAVTDSTRAWAVDAAAKDGVLKDAKALGLSVATVTDAMLGSKPAAQALNDQIEILRNGMREQVNAAGDAGVAYDDFNGQVANVREAIDGTNTTLAKARDEVLLKAQAMGKDTEATAQNAAAATAAKAQTEALASAHEISAKAAEEAKKALDELISSIENYGDTVNNALDATSAYEAALDDASAALEKNGKTATAGGKAINLHTEAGRANDKALRDIATSALKAATANFENGRSVKSVTGDVTKARGEFVTMATKMGMSKEAANKLATQLGLTKGNVSRLNGEINKTPAKKATAMEVKTAAAIAALKALQTRINGLRGGDVKITTRYVTIGQPGGGANRAGGTTKDAEGSIHEFASGGYAPIGPQQPQIRAAGGTGMTWAEHGAGPWEAYISGNPAKKDRSLAIWEDTGRRLGAFEAMRSQPAAAAPVAVDRSRTIQVTASGPGADEIAAALDRRERRLEALNPTWG